MYYKDIGTAIRAERPTDMIVRKLTNKYAIVRSLLTNGNYSEPSIAMLCSYRNIVVFGGSLKGINSYVKHCLNIPKFSYYMRYKGDGAYRSVRCDNRGFIKKHRQLARVLTEHGIINL